MNHRSLMMVITVAMIALLRAPAAGNRTAECGGSTLVLDDIGKVILLDTCTGQVRRATSITLPWTAIVAARTVVIATVHDIILLDGELRVLAHKPIPHVRHLAVLGDKVVATTLIERRPLVLSTRTLDVLDYVPVAGQGALAAVRGRVVGALAPGTIWSSDGKHVERVSVPIDMLDAVALGKGTLLVGHAIAGSQSPPGHVIALGLGVAGSKPIEIDLGIGHPVMVVVRSGNAYVVSGLCGYGYRVSRVSSQGALVSTRPVGAIRAGAVINDTIVLASQSCGGDAEAALEALDPVTLEVRPLPPTQIDTPRLLRDATALH